MAHSQLDYFLREATSPDFESDTTLNRDSFYGLYTSWCFLSGHAPQSERAFWAGIGHRVSPGQSLKMKGPAAADYILTSYQAVV